LIDIDLNARSPLRLSKNGNFSPNQKQSVKPILKKEGPSTKLQCSTSHKFSRSNKWHVPEV